MRRHAALVLRCLDAVDRAARPPSHRDASCRKLRLQQPDLLACAPSALTLLLSSLDGLLSSLSSSPLFPPSSPRSSALYLSLTSRLTSLLRLCDAKFLCYPYASVPLCWRRLYTDAIILSACAAILFLEPGKQDQRWSKAVRDLDLAIIIAGCPGDEREELVQLLIRVCQCGLKGEKSDEEEQEQEGGGHRHSLDHEIGRAKRPRLAENGSVQRSKRLFHPTSIAALSIDSFNVPPSLPHFLSPSAPRGTYRTPFIVRNFASDWPALALTSMGKPRWASSDYLVQLAGPARVVPVEVGAKYTDEGWGQDVVEWREFLKLSRWDQDDDERGKEDEKETPTLYLAQHDLLKQFPQMWRDIVLPDYVYSCPPAPDHDGENAKWGKGKKYSPPKNEEGLIVNAWIGPEGTVSPPHHDPYYNCFVQLHGHKEIWLAPPSSDSGGGMSSFGSPSCSSSQPHSSDGGIATSLMTNTSRLDVFTTDEATLPTAFRETVKPQAQKAVLAPGDLLFLPPGWWHAVRSLQKSVSVSMWF
ncbi:hypothetical protein ACQY0O_005548 [Thecaphora frezii]